MKLGACGIIALAATGAWLAFPAPADAGRRTFTFESDTTFSVSGKLWLEVDNPVGDVTVFPGPSSQIRVRRLARIAASDSAHAADFLDEIDVRFRPTESGVEIRANVNRKDRTFSFWNGLLAGHGPRRTDIDLEIEVPPACDIRLQTTSGDIDLSGIEGDLRIDAGSGDMTIEDVRGQIDIRGSSGDVRLSHAIARVSVEVSSGDLTIEHVNGDVAATASSGDITVRDMKGDLETQSNSGDQELEGINGPVRARAFSGNIECSSEAGDVDVRASSGDARIDTRLADNGRCRIVTSSGDVTLALAEHPGAKIDITTRSGEASDNMDVSWRRESSRHRTGTFGDGRADVQIQTGSGDVRLEGRP